MEQTQPIRLLVVDDDPVVLEVMSGLLTEKGFLVFTADDWTEVAEVLFVERPEVILLDVMLPGVSGDSIAQIIRETVRPRPRVLLHSSMPKEELAALSSRAEVSGFLHKGCPTETLLEALRAAGRQYRCEGTFPPPRPPPKEDPDEAESEAVGGELLLAGPPGTERVMVQSALVGAGFQVHLASTWGELLEEVSRDRVCLIILDDRLVGISPIPFRRATRRLEMPPGVLLWSSLSPLERGGLERDLRAMGVVFQGAAPDFLVQQVKGLLRR
jgi:DNA-binding response OmpR family regulator